MTLYLVLTGIQLFGWAGFPLPPKGMMAQTWSAQWWKLVNRRKATPRAENLRRTFHVAGAEQHPLTTAFLTDLVLVLGIGRFSTRHEILPNSCRISRLAPRPSASRAVQTANCNMLLLSAAQGGSNGDPVRHKCPRAVVRQTRPTYVGIFARTASTGVESSKKTMVPWPFCAARLPS